VYTHMHQVHAWFPGFPLYHMLASCVRAHAYSNFLAFTFRIFMFKYYSEARSLIVEELHAALNAPGIWLFSLEMTPKRMPTPKDKVGSFSSSMKRKVDTMYELYVQTGF